MTGEPVSDPYLARRRKAEQSIVNAPVRDQLAAISNWHDSENPSRMALGAVASAALNHIQKLEADAERYRWIRWAMFCLHTEWGDLLDLTGNARTAIELDMLIDAKRAVPSAGPSPGVNDNER